MILIIMSSCRFKHDLFIAHLTLKLIAFEGIIIQINYGNKYLIAMMQTHSFSIDASIVWIIYAVTGMNHVS